METHARSLVKAVSWRAIAFCILATISYAFTGNVRETGLITAVYTLVQVGTYWAHERAWQRVKWGCGDHPLASLPVDRPLTPRDMKDISERLKDLGYM